MIEVGCLKVCPKHAVTVIDTARPGEWLVVKAGTPVDVVAQRVGLVDGPRRDADLASPSPRDLDFVSGFDQIGSRMDPQTSSG